MLIIFSAARLLFTGVLLFVLGCAVPEWRAPFGRDHPLAGEIWDVSAASFVDREALVSRLARARFVLLGEKHDNPDHHFLQAQLVRALIEAGRRPAVGFEMFNLDDAPAIAGHLAEAPTDAAGLGAAVQWDKRGWPSWEFYQPIAEAALEEGLPIVAANLSPSIVSTLHREGTAGLPGQLLHRLELDQQVPQDVMTRLTAEIRKAHCGYASEESVGAMVTVQRARDAQMAESMIAAGLRDGTVLIVGAGHARNDYGIPAHLASKALGQSVISLAFLEVNEGQVKPESYAVGFDRTMLPFDYVWFTPRVDNLDPCEKFKAELERLKRKK